MIKVILFDLDDTLIITNFSTFFPSYLQRLGAYGSTIAKPDKFIQKMMAAYDMALQTYDPAKTLYERFLMQFARQVEHDAAELKPFFDTFYSEEYPKLRSIIQPRETTPGLLKWLSEQGYRLVVATNPAMPESSIIQRMQWGGLEQNTESFELVTTLETMHFGKPQSEYFEEILLRLDVTADQAIMVGDSWDDDIASAAAAGLNTFWITDEKHEPRDESLVDGYGSLAQFSQLVQSGWLERLSPKANTPQALIQRLATFPAAVDTLRRTYPREILECCPGKDEWSVRDIVCHLRDHEVEEDQARLKRIAAEDNPFLSGNYDPWAHVHECAEVSVKDALAEFIDLRVDTVTWLKTLSAPVWQRPARHAIFGLTHFQEMVRFMTEHDRTHLRQMVDAIQYALGKNS